VRAKIVVVVTPSAERLARMSKTVEDLADRSIDVSEIVPRLGDPRRYAAIAPLISARFCFNVWITRGSSIPRRIQNQPPTRNSKLGAFAA